MQGFDVDSAADEPVYSDYSEDSDSYLSREVGTYRMEGGVSEGEAEESEEDFLAKYGEFFTSGIAKLDNGSGTIRPRSMRQLR